MQWAVSLGSDQAGPKEERWKNRRFTGAKAYAQWEALLRNMDEPVVDRHHANVLLQLRNNRTAAVAYLNTFAKGAGHKTSNHLRVAAICYQELLDRLKQADTSQIATNKDKRLKFADAVHEMAVLEAQAMTRIKRAADAMIFPTFPNEGR